MKEYDLYLPLHYNNGRAIDPAKLSYFKRVLVEEFGGLTHFPQENEGLWRFGGITFRDRVVILRVLSNEPEVARAFFANLKVEIQRELEQADVLIVEREVRAIS